MYIYIYIYIYTYGDEASREASPVRRTVRSWTPCRGLFLSVKYKDKSITYKYIYIYT